MVFGRRENSFSSSDVCEVDTMRSEKLSSNSMLIPLLLSAYCAASFLRHALIRSSAVAFSAESPSIAPIASLCE